MTIRTLALGAAALALTGMVLPAQAQDSTTQRSTPVTTTTTVQDKNVIAALRDAGNFTIFLSAVNAAGLTGQLEGPGPFTVFAPTDDAFGRVPQVRRDSLMQDKAALEVLIKNHVVQGRLTADEARLGANGMSFLGGAAIKVDTTGANIKVNGAQVIKGNLEASNGIIHAIDQVWLPPYTERVRGTTPADSASREGKPKN